MTALPQDSEIRPVVERSVKKLTASLGDRQKAGLEVVLRLKGCTSDDPWAYFNPLLPPVLRWPLWAAELATRAGRPPRPDQLADAIDAAVSGVLFARIQDAAVDGHGLDPIVAMATGDACLVRHLTCLSRIAGGSHELLDLATDVWGRYSEALLLERELVSEGATITEELFEQMLDQSRPVFLPGAAILAASGLHSSMSAASAILDHAVWAGQLFDDTMDAVGDARAGNTTYVLHRLGTGSDIEQLRQRLYVDGAFDELLTEAQAVLGRAVAAAMTAGFDIVAKDLDATRGEIERIRAHVLRQWLARAIGDRHVGQ